MSNITKYNESQLRAIAHADGPAVVLAGPGSGKTAVLTARLQHLINELHIDPSRILVIAFTRASAAEMKERFLQLEPSCGTVVFGTFHSVFWSILRTFAMRGQQSLFQKGFSILEEWEKKQIVRDYLHKTAPDMMYDDYIVETYCDEISAVKSCEAGDKRKKRDPYITGLVEWYEQNKKERGRIDYEDILYACDTLLKNDIRLLQLLQEKYRYILIDEFQDINEVQYRVIRKLSERHRGLFAVGDDDQAIYGFRGSDPLYMVQFKEEYPDSSTYTLNTNYRSGKAVTEAAGRLIRHNAERIEKHIISGRKQTGKVIRSVFESRDGEAEFICRAIRKLHASGTEYRKIAVLGRTRLMLSHIRSKLTEYGIPISVDSKAEGICGHFLMGDIEAYYTAAICKESIPRREFLRIMNRPFRDISRAALSEERITWNMLEGYYAGSKSMMEALRLFRFQLSVLRTLPVELGIDYIRRIIGYDDFLEEYAHKISADSAEWKKLLERISREAAVFIDPRKWIENNEDERKRRSKQERNAADEAGVSLSTYHGVKGLEYSAVFMPTMNEGTVPDKKAASEKELEEERRLVYVAMTRAADLLCLSWVKQINGKRVCASRYIKESES